jgi:hypothetical protein
MTDTTTPTAPTAPAAAATPAAPTSAGVAAVRIVTGTKRVQAQVGGQWHDLQGIALADLYTSDPRYAAKVTFAAIGTISQAQVGAAPVGIDGSQVKARGPLTSAPVHTVSDPADGQVTVHSPATSSKFTTQNAAIAMATAAARIITAHKAEQAKAAAVAPVPAPPAAARPAA